MRIFINAGHHLKDSGTVHGEHKENEMAIDLVKQIRKQLNAEEVILVPDVLDLKETIAWVNERANKDDLAFSVHFNSHRASYVHGTEAYYSNDREKEIAVIFAEEVSRAGGFKNRGARHDSGTWVGSLGWLRKLKCDSVLVEVCYLSSERDTQLYRASKVAPGFLGAVRETEAQLWQMPSLAEIQSEINILTKMVEALIRALANLISKQ